MSPLGNEDARAQVGAKGGLSQRWREAAANGLPGLHYKHRPSDQLIADAEDLDAAKLRIEKAVKALANYNPIGVALVDREAVLKIIREIL